MAGERSAGPLGYYSSTCCVHVGSWLLEAFFGRGWWWVGLTFFLPSVLKTCGLAGDVRQDKLGPKGTYMASQTDINEKFRAILIDWLVEVHLKFKELQETLFLTVAIVDRFLEKKTIQRNNLQLVGIAGACTRLPRGAAILYDICLFCMHDWPRTVLHARSARSHSVPLSHFLHFV